MDFLILKNSENSILLPLCICTLFFRSAILWEQNPRFWLKKRTKLRTKSGIMNIRAKRLSLPFAIRNIIRQRHQSRAWLLLILHCMQTSLLSLFYCILFSPVTDSTENKHYKSLFFFFLTFYWIILRFLVLKIITVLSENFKKSGKTKSKLKRIYPKNHESFMSSKPRVQFYWFL